MRGSSAAIFVIAALTIFDLFNTGIYLRWYHMSDHIVYVLMTGIAPIGVILAIRELSQPQSGQGEKT